MKVVEKFISINGEGKRAGELAAFIRFKGCNLRCSYCDTLWALEPDCAFSEETPEEITQFILDSKIKDVTLTGGGPLIQPEIKKLIQLILNSNSDTRVEIETNGAVLLKDFRIDNSSRLSFTMDYKLPSSGFESSMKLENFQYLTKNDSVK
ncbi:MAG: 4Fe-4S cluster-binding domain-containing protein, partial [Candidatus Riflebacteria bacterium]|nr:4Fe-4S cluster-binding domain-containing protein [Candidatus Riflebacteria bacterium]